MVRAFERIFFSAVKVTRDYQYLQLNVLAIYPDTLIERHCSNTFHVIDMKVLPLLKEYIKVNAVTHSHKFSCGRTRHINVIYIRDVT